MNTEPLIVCFLILLLNCISLYYSLHLKSGQRCYDGRICKFTADCPGVLDGINNGTFPIVCGFEGLKPIICCPGTENETSIDDNKSTVAPPVQSGAVPGDAGAGDITYVDHNWRLNSARKMCKQYISEACKGSLIIRAGDPEQQLPQLDETITDPQRYPFMAMIGYGESKNIHWRCGGSLISNQFVLSAAKCATTSLGDARWVRLGELNFQVKTDTQHRDFQIIKRYVHPQYNKSFIQHDIALFKLHERITFTSTIRPICLDLGANLDTATVVGIGWGLNNCPQASCSSESDANTSNVLTKVSPFPVDDNACNLTFYARTEWGTGIIPNATFCTSNLQNYRKNCQGLAGDPVLFLNEGVGCPLTYTQFGVLSTVEHWLVEDRCTYIHSTNLYTQVSHYILWIETALGWRN